MMEYGYTYDEIMNIPSDIYLMMVDKHYTDKKERIKLDKIRNGYK